MKLSFTVSDEIFEIYVKRFGLPKAYAIMRQAVEAFKDVDDKDRWVFLAGDDRRAIEATFQTTIGSGKQLAKLCDRLSNIKLGDVEIPFLVDELERLKMQASFHGKDINTFIRELADQIKLQILELY